MSQSFVRDERRWGAMPGTYPSAELAIAYTLQRGGIATRSPQGYIALGNLAIDPAEGEVRRGGKDYAWVSVGHWGQNREAALRCPMHVLAGLLSHDGDQVLMGGIRAKAIAYRGNRLIAMAGAPDPNWRHSPKACLLASLRMNEVGYSTAEWEVPFELRRYGEPIRNESKSEIRTRTPPEALACAGDTTSLVSEDRQLLVFDLKDGTLRQTIDLPAPTAQAGIAVADGLVIVACLDESVIALR